MNAHTPPPMNSAMPSTMNSGWYSANATMRRITARTSLLGGDQPLEEQRAVDAHAIGRAHAFEAPLLRVGDRPEPHRAAGEAPLAFVDENEILLTAQVDRPRRHQVTRGRRRGRSTCAV